MSAGAARPSRAVMADGWSHLGLADSEELFRNVFVQAALPQAAISADSGCYVAANDLFCELVGHPLDALLRLGFKDVTHPDDWPMNEAVVRRLLSGDLPGGVIEKRYVSADGDTRYVRNHLRVVRDDDGRARYVHGLVIDITEQRRAEEALATSEARYRALVEHSEDLVLLLRVDGTVSYVSPNAGQLAPALLRRGASVFDLVAPAEAAPLRDALIDVGLHGGVRRLQLRDTSTGLLRHWDARLQGRLAQRELNGVVATLRHATERVHDEQLVEGEAAVLRLLLTGADRDAGLAEVARLAEGIFPQLKAAISLVAESGTKLRHGAAPSLSSEYAEAVDGMPVAPASGVCGAAAFRNEAVVVPDIRQDPLTGELADVLAGLGLRSCLALPIAGADGEVAGILGLFGTDTGAPAAETWRVAHRLAQLAALVISGRGGSAGASTRPAAGRHPSPLDGLTPRERDVLRAIALGYTHAEIAEELEVSLRTVEGHRASLQRKLRVRRRADLVRLALSAGLLEP